MKKIAFIMIVSLLVATSHAYASDKEIEISQMTTIQINEEIVKQQGIYDNYVAIDTVKTSDLLFKAHTFEEKIAIRNEIKVIREAYKAAAKRLLELKIEIYERNLESTN